MIEFWTGYGCGAVTFSYFAWRIHCSMVKRLFTIREDGLLATKLENQRIAHDSGRTEQVREGAGPSGEVSGLFEMRPGTMTLNHLQEKEIAKRLDTQSN